jgi:hypothetical protein
MLNMEDLDKDVQDYFNHLIKIGFFTSTIEKDNSLPGPVWYKFHFSQFVIDNLDVGEKKFIEFNEESIKILTDDCEFVPKLCFMRDLGEGEIYAVFSELNNIRNQKNHFENLIGEAKPAKKDRF